MSAERPKIFCIGFHKTGTSSMTVALREFFEGRPDDLLIMDLTAGDGWPELCEFLGYATPDKPFPRANTAESRRHEPIMKRVQRRLKRWFGA